MYGLAAALRAERARVFSHGILWYLADRRIIQALLPVATVIFCVLVLEAGLRLVGYAPYYLDRKAFIPSPNPQEIYELRPGFRGLYAGAPIRINSHGLRGPDSSPGTPYRAVLLGDSIAFGQGVPEGATLADQLAQRLDSAVPNLGVPGYDTCQELPRFQQEGLILRPRVAILIYCENDTDPPVFAIRSGEVVPPDMKSTAWGRFMAVLRTHSYAYNLLQTRWRLAVTRVDSTNQYAETMKTKFQPGSPGWIRSRSCLAALIASAQAAQIRVIVIPYPVLTDVNQRPYPFAGYIDTVCQAARANGAECLDVLPVLQRLGPPLRVSNLDPHPSAQVYRSLADKIVRMLL